MQPLVHLLNIGHAKLFANWNWQNVCSPFYRVYYVDKGRASMTLPDGEHPLRAGCLYLIPAFVRHDCHCDSEFHHYYMHVFLGRKFGDSTMGMLNLPFEVPATPLDVTLIERLLAINPARELANSNPLSYDTREVLEKNIGERSMRDFCARVESAGILMQLMSRFMDGASFKMEVADERVRNAARHISANLSRHISLDDLAAVASMSKDHLIRLFKSQIGESPVQYINRKRIEVGQMMLLGGGPIKEIAFELGFEDQSYFVRLFRKYTGQSPSEYRRRALLAPAAD